VYEVAPIVSDELTFRSKISKMGNNRIIWVPMALHEMIRDFEKTDIMVSIKKVEKSRWCSKVLKFSNNFSKTSISLLFISLIRIGKPLH